MKFYTSVGPNPRVVALFMAEKGISIPEVVVDLRGGENRRALVRFHGREARVHPMCRTRNARHSVALAVGSGNRRAATQLLQRAFACSPPM